ncbi:TPA: phage tail protein [Enterobacter cloacae]|nr:phage tail protein [Enterobacter cloacae]
MSAKFYTLLTDIGAAKLANAAALGVPLKITQMAVGDGGGVLPTPNAQQTKLVGEKRRAALNMLYIDPQNSSQVIAEQVIPETEGGWWIREVGLFDETGALIAVGNCPESYKPQLAEGSGRTQTVRMVLITSSTDNITLKIDPSVVLATRKYVDDKVLELKVYVDELMAAHLAAADPHSQYAPKASPTFTGTPKAPTAAAGNNSTQLANTAFVQAAIAGLVGSSPAALDTLNELAAALGNDPNFAATMTNALANKQPLDNTLTALSGKSVGALLEYLGLGTAKFVTSRGRNANGTWVIWSDGAIEMMGYGVTIDNGLATVNYPIELPDLSRYISIAERLAGDSGASVNSSHTSMVIDSLTTKAGFKARCTMSATGNPSSNGFSWRVYYAPV